ncbi:MAG: hypothetical protein AAF990_08330 [Bacteroidota bacterium]
MKQYFIYLLCIPFLFGSSCGKDDLGINRKMIGLLNGERWEAKGNFTYNLPHGIGLDIRFEIYNSAGELREKLLIFKVPFEVGNYPITIASIRDTKEEIGAVYWTLSNDGDVIDDTYELYVPAENTISITEADTIRHILKGEVNATFLVDPLDVEDTDVDTIRIENGLFEITLRD